MSPVPVPQLRGTDRALPRRMSALAGIGEDGQLDAVVVGRLLLAGEGLLTVLAAFLLRPDPAGWAALGVVSTIMTGLLAASFLVPWARMAKRATMLFPLLTVLGLGAIAVADVGVFAPVGGYLTLTFAYLGVTQPARRSLLFVAPAGSALVALYGELTAPVLVRLIIAVSIWVCLAELLAGLVARQATLRAALHSAAFTDVLTGVPNRRDLDMRLATAGAGDCLVVLDLDHFKRINDTAGHEAGDRVLADFGAMLRGTMRAQDYCARFGGEEFVLLLTGTDAAAAVALIDRLRRAWRVLRPSITFSAGIAGFAALGTAAEVLAAADAALYSAKAAGRDTERLAAA